MEEEEESEPLLLWPGHLEAATGAALQLMEESVPLEIQKINYLTLSLLNACSVPVPAG